MATKTKRKTKTRRLKKAAGRKPAAKKHKAKRPAGASSPRGKAVGQAKAATASGRKPSGNTGSKRTGAEATASKTKTRTKTKTSTRRTAAAGLTPLPGGHRRRPPEGETSALRGRARPSVRKLAMPRPGRRRTAPVSANVPGVAIGAKPGPRHDEILTPAALSFVADMHRHFDGVRKRLLAMRVERQKRYDAGELPDFLPETQHIRDGNWKIAPIPKDLLDRRVEITGPVDRKMIINALNSGASVFMADFEDANSPTWANTIEGQINLKDRWQGTIDFTDPATGKDYRVGQNPAVLIVRPRGWHLLEEHVTVNGQPISGSLFDFGLYFFHNAKTLIERGTGPYFYLPKLETHLEARLWNDVFVYAQKELDIPPGTIKATVLIETLPAAFEMEEILYELRDHITGLNAGRWDYIFSFIKKLAKNANYVLPDRSQVVMGEAFLHAYALLLIHTCHKRGAFAMGGMAAQIPIKGDPRANEAAFAKVRADKEREARDGHDGTWVAHPDLVPVAKEVFDRLMPQPNQLGRLREDVHVTRDDLLEIHKGTKTDEGFRNNIRVGVQYIEAWLRGRGAVPIYNLMEDAATAEISRAQIWQWIKYGAVLDNSAKVTPQYFERALGEEMDRVKREIGPENYEKGRFPEAIKLFHDISLRPEFEEFLTIPAYRLIV